MTFLKPQWPFHSWWTFVRLELRISNEGCLRSFMKSAMVSRAMRKLPSSYMISTKLISGCDRMLTRILESPREFLVGQRIPDNRNGQPYTTFSFFQIKFIKTSFVSWSALTTLILLHGEAFKSFCPFHSMYYNLVWFLLCNTPLMY